MKAEEKYRKEKSSVQNPSHKSKKRLFSISVQF